MAQRCASATFGRPSPDPRTPRERRGRRTSGACFSSYGANVIDTVERIKAELPRLRAATPPTLQVDVISDRTQTIRASVEDVQVTLLITIGLVVGVIFVFLRTFWATLIPS